MGDGKRRKSSRQRSQAVSKPAAAPSVGKLPLWRNKALQLLLECLGLIVLLATWYYHSSAVTKLSSAFADWRAFATTASGHTSTGLPDEYTELNLVASLSKRARTDSSYEGAYFYIPAWEDIGVQRAWMRFMNAQYSWAGSVEQFIYSQQRSLDLSPTTPQAIHAAIEGYDAIVNREFGGRERDPALLHPEQASRLNERVMQLKSTAFEALLEWGRQIQVRKDQISKRYSWAYLIGSVLLIGAKALAACSENRRQPAV